MLSNNMRSHASTLNSNRLQRLHFRVLLMLRAVQCAATAQAGSHHCSTHGCLTHARCHHMCIATSSITANSLSPILVDSGIAMQAWCSALGSIPNLTASNLSAIWFSSDLTDSKDLLPTSILFKSLMPPVTRQAAQNLQRCMLLAHSPAADGRGQC